MRHLFSIPLGQEIAPKAIPKNSATAAVIGAVGALGSAALNAYSTNRSNVQNANLDKTNREFALYRDKLNYQRDVDFWNMNNAYNTPSAQRQRLQEAGYNPWISGSGGLSNTSQIPSSREMSSVPVHSQMQPVKYGDMFGAFTEGLGNFLQAKQIDANVANQSAETMDKGWEIFKEARMNGMDKESAWKMVQPIFKTSAGLSESNKYLDMWNQQFESLQWQNKQAQLSFDINSKLSERERQTALMVSESQIDKIRGELGLMSSQADLNRSNIDVNKQKIKESISSVVRNIADAYKLKKEGDKYVADTKTINGIRDLIIEGMRFKNQILSEPANDAGARNQGKTGFRNWLISPEGQEELKVKGIKENSGTLDVIQYATGLYNDVIPNIFVPAY